jgi:hypothetical protein
VDLKDHVEKAADGSGLQKKAIPNASLKWGNINDEFNDESSAVIYDRCHIQLNSIDGHSRLAKLLDRMGGFTSKGASTVEVGRF